MKTLFSLLILSLAIIFRISAQEAAVRKAHFNLETSGLAIQGYDPVAYFSDHKAIEGDDEITAVHNNVIYHFATIKNKDTFTSNPEKYEPQYGGWCAYAMGATGEKVEVDPETFKIVDGKLYLFYNKFFTNTLPEWNKDEAHLKANADKHWTKFVR